MTGDATTVAGELGVVIPTLDEAEALPHLLRDLSRLTIPRRVVVVDGGSTDDTVAVARAGGSTVLRGRRGRGSQLNAGARFLTSEWLLFLHADSRLDRTALAAVEKHMQSATCSAAYFALRLAHPHFFYRLIEGGQRLRERHWGLVYGDQGLLIPRELFYTVGPYPAVPIMEDVTLARRLLDAGLLMRLDAEITTSARRYEEEGRIRGWVRNARLITRFLAGGDPAELVAAYPARRSGAGSRRRSKGSGRPPPAVLVFAKAPRPGQVKTRLAESVGPERAAFLYRRMGRAVIDQIADESANLVVCYDPPDGEDEVRRWLGPAPSAFVSQGEGNLGDRMARMFAFGLRTAEHVVLVGTDTPTLSAGAIRRASHALDTADLVLGPAEDGGYYLIALKAPQPTLFRGIAWSTDEVLTKTVANAEEIGLRVTFLEVEVDVDTVADLTPELLARLEANDGEQG